MDPKELYPSNDPYHTTGEEKAPEKDAYGYHKPGAAITAMVLGICSVSLWFYPFLTSIPCIIEGSRKNRSQVFRFPEGRPHYRDHRRRFIIPVYADYADCHSRKPPVTGMSGTFRRNPVFSGY